MKTQFGDVGNMSVTESGNILNQDSFSTINNFGIGFEYISLVLKYTKCINLHIQCISVKK